MIEPTAHEDGPFFVDIVDTYGDALDRRHYSSAETMEAAEQLAAMKNAEEAKLAKTRVDGKGEWLGVRYVYSARGSID